MIWQSVGAAVSTQNSHDEQDGHDERVHPRHAIRERALIRLLDRDRTAECEVLDLSLGGCRLSMLERLPVAPGMHVEGTFRIQGTPLRVGGVIRWTNGKDCFGVLFNQMGPRSQSILTEIIDELRTRKDAMIRAALKQESMQSPER